MVGSDVRLAPDSFSWADFRTLPLTTAEELKAEPETFLCVPAKEIARIITLKTSGSTGAPKRLFFTEDDLMQTADFFETGMQYMVKPGDRVTVYMEGPGFFSIGGLLKEGLGRIQVETRVHGLIRDMEAAARDGEGADCLIGVPSQMYALAAHAPGTWPENSAFKCGLCAGQRAAFFGKNMELPGLYTLGDDGNWLRRRRTVWGARGLPSAGPGPFD